MAIRRSGRSLRQTYGPGNGTVQRRRTGTDDLVRYVFPRSLGRLEDYYNVKPDTDMRTGALPPEGMSLVYWDYYHTDEEYYRNYIKLHRQLTDRVIFAGGGWTWCGIAPALQTAEAVTRAAFRACRAEKVAGCNLYAVGG